MPEHPHEHDRPPLGEPFRLQLGARVSLADQAVTLAFVEVVEDSRCPTGMRCVWPGQAVIAVDVSTASTPAAQARLTLRSGQRALAVTTVAGYRLELEALEPYPTREQPAAGIKQYVATLSVTRA